MSERFIKYASASATITCQLAPGGTGLVTGAAREGTAIDNSSNLYVDAMVYLAIKLNTGTPGSDKCINVWFYASEDGTNFGDNATGSDAGITLRTPNNFLGPWVINTPDAGALTYKTVIPSVARFFGGILPKKWGIVIENRTNLTLDTTEGNHTKEYRGITETVA